MSNDLHSPNLPAELPPENPPAGAPPAEPLAVRPRPFQFGMRALLVVMLVGGAALGLVGLMTKQAVEKAREAQSLNNLKQLGLGLHIFHDLHNGFPAQASTDPAGQPLLSWRVHILPLVEENHLYQQFRLDEPWNSPHNARLIPLMPKIYESPISRPGRKPLPAGRTCYLAVVGPETMFPPPGGSWGGTPLPGGLPYQVGLPLASTTDGLSNTIMVVEAAPEEAVIWTRPDDWAFDPLLPKAGLIGHRERGFQALFGDGSVRVMPGSVSDETLRRLFNRHDGQSIDTREFEP
jgi:hypothetical protein